MSINDPQWGNSHRPEQKEPDQAPDNAGAAPAQPESAAKDQTPLTGTDTAKETSGGTKSASSGGHQPAGGASPRPPKQNPDGPPDLEELCQQLVYRARCRIAAILRRPPPPAPRPIARPAAESASPAEVGGNAQSTAEGPSFNWQALSWQSWLIGVTLIFGAWLMSGFYLVDANQRGVVSRFGVVSGTTEPGWQWRWPYPFESVRLVNVAGERTLEVGLTASGRQAQGLMLTADQSLVAVSYAVVHQVNDPVAYVTQLEAPAELLGTLSETALRDAIAGQSLASLQQSLSAKERTSTAQAANMTPVVPTALPLEGARQQIQLALDEIQAGLFVKNVMIWDLRLRGPVLQAARQAEQDAQARIRSFREAQGAATDGLIKAHKLAGQLQSNSLAYGDAIDNAVSRLTTAAPTDLTVAQGEVSALNQSLRQQFPLLFASRADLLARTSTATLANAPLGATTGAKSSLTGAVTAPPVAGEWRDRNMMRDRERVDRPG